MGEYNLERNRIAIESDTSTIDVDMTNPEDMTLASSSPSDQDVTQFGFSDFEITGMESGDDENAPDGNEGDEAPDNTEPVSVNSDQQTIRGELEDMIRAGHFLDANGQVSGRALEHIRQYMERANQLDTWETVTSDLENILNRALAPRDRISATTMRPLQGPNGGLLSYSDAPTRQVQLSFQRAGSNAPSSPSGHAGPTTYPPHTLQIRTSAGAQSVSVRNQPLFF